MGLAIAAKPIGAHPKTIPKTIPPGRFVHGAATAKPIGAHPTLGCPFAMYQILSVTHMYIYICSVLSVVTNENNISIHI